MAESIAVAATQAPPESAFVPIIDDICYRAQLAARNQKMSSAVGATKVLGFLIGALFALGMVLIPLALIGGL
ncbi:MAG TPA: tetrahydromethanopterin S-methyltransferase subunit F [Methanocella sp.]|uniref:tetrahydromethanopterin S-methyltransferase subunit F n=1 Tax=Methanocella sp. TaxID=2052833 RepID=UPI002C2F3586|nr:tetrahydromethanopterin S-methyltransferase subunit F [Methanocella sp.]HTY89606.1 tetrahydromethanopterin S-methyltransferase subunit F [Methanocella sp.]